MLVQMRSIDLLDTQTYFELLKLPYPSHRDAVLERLQSDQLLDKTSKGWTIPNLSAILLARQLESFSPTLARKAPRVIIFDILTAVNGRRFPNLTI